MVTKPILAILFLITCTVCFADSLTLKLPALQISQTENRKNVVYDFEESPTMIIVSDSVLYADPLKYNYRVELNKISKLTIKSGTNLLPVAIFSFAIGGLLGTGVAGWGPHPTTPSTKERIEGAIIVGTIFTLLSTGIAWLISHDDTYSLTGKSMKEKREILIKALNKNKKK
jgi:hypothetical protein